MAPFVAGGLHIGSPGQYSFYYLAVDQSIKADLASVMVFVVINHQEIFIGKSSLTDLDPNFLLKLVNYMSDLTKTEIMEKLLKLVQTDRDLTFLLSLEEKDLTTLLIALRERIENIK
jgi:hypothetical protein